MFYESLKSTEAFVVKGFLHNQSQITSLVSGLIIV